MLSLLAVPFAIAAALLGGAIQSVQQGGMPLLRLIAAVAVMLFAIGAFSVLGLGEDAAPKPALAEGEAGEAKEPEESEEPASEPEE